MEHVPGTGVGEVVKRHRLRYAADRVVSPATDAPPFHEYFREELGFNLRELAVGRSRAGAGETILFPLIREVWKPYRQQLSLFAREPLAPDADRVVTPDYVICKRSEFGPALTELPYLLVVQTATDDFESAWGQCLTGMLTAQKLNGTPDRPVCGIASNGKTWEFGVLLGTEFTRDPEPIALHTLDLLGQALHAVFRACRDLALAAPVTPVANPARAAA